jgi:hypothetical protein
LRCHGIRLRAHANRPGDIHQAEVVVRKNNFRS